MMRNNAIDGLQKKLIDEHCKISDKTMLVCLSDKTGHSSKALADSHFK